MTNVFFISLVASGLGGRRPGLWVTGGKRPVRVESEGWWRVGWRIGWRVG